MTDDEIIAEAIKFLELCNSMDGGDRAEAIEDLKFRKGEQWDEESVRQRKIDGRPCLTINNVPSIIHQVTNDVRQNQQSIHIHPSDAGASPEVAEIMEGLCRHIEYDSAADAAYDTAVDYAASIGFGYFRLVTEYCDPKSFDQDMKIKRVRNPFTVYLDPGAEEADGSDARRGIISTKLAKDVFKLDYPKRDATKAYLPFGSGDTRSWIDDEWVRVAEYYRVEEQTETLARLSDGSTQFATDKTPLKPGVFPTGETRTTTARKVMWYKITALEVLDRAEVPFDWIPIFPVYGDEIDIDGKTCRSGLIRYLKDPKRMENYWTTAATEEIALRTKTPFIAAFGQLEGFEDEWNSANTVSYSYLHYNPITIDGTLAPPPQRQPPADVPGGYIAMAGIARDSVKAVTGIYDASLGNRSNETSGIAIRNRQHQGEIANFHFSDNLSRAIRHLGRVIVSGIPRVYDTQRMLRIVKPDGTHKNVEINAYDRAAEVIKNDLTVGKYDAVVTSGPAYNTLREEAAAGMLEMGGKWPKLLDVAGDKVVRAFDWPGASEIADILETSIGRPKEEGEEEENMVQTPNGAIPAAQAGQMIGQMDDTLSKMHEEMQALESGLRKTELEIASREKIAKMQIEGKHDDTELSGMVQLILGKVETLTDWQAKVQELEHHKELAAQAHEQLMQQQAESQPPATPATPSEPTEPVDIKGIIGQIGQALNPPRTKRMAITAPSGAVYHGEMQDDVTGNGE